MNKLKNVKESFNKSEIISKKQHHQAVQSNPLSFQSNFKIYLRVKPSHPQHPSSSITIINQRQIEIIPPYFSTETDRIYEYQEVFDQTATNHQVFLKTMQEPIQNVLQGYNSTIFIYGMTGAGKTHTMFKSTNSGHQNQGIVCMSIDKLFDHIKGERERRYEILLSFYQIYNESIRDLLSDNSQALNIMEDNKGTIIHDLKEQPIANSTAAKNLVFQGLNKRSMNATKNNEVSSRSHAILQFTVRKHLEENKENSQITILQSKLFMIDLAGNEKACQHENKRFIEGININKSLLTLGKCINILSQQKKTNFIPFRDSKLTRILKDSLGGNSKTVMIACISSDSRFYEQTLNTLKYSNKAKKIQNKGKGGSIKILKRKETQIIVAKKQKNIKESSIAINYNQHLNNNRQQKENSTFQILQKLLMERLKIEKMMEDLQVCFAEDENDIKMGNNRQECIQNMKDISTILPKLKAKLQDFKLKISRCKEEILKESQNQGHECEHKGQIDSYKYRINEQDAEINMLRQMLDGKEGKNSQSMLKMNNILNKSNDDTLSDSSLPMNKKLENTLKSNSFILIDDSKHTNQDKSNKQTLKINLMASGNHKGKQNMMIHQNNNVQTPQSSLKSSKILSAHSLREELPSKSKTHRLYTKPTINITMDNIKLNSPQTKMLLKHSIKSRFQQREDDTEQRQQRKQQFITQLKQIDRNVHFFSKQRIWKVLEEYDRQGYDLNKTEKSIMNKIRFTYKTTVKSPTIILRQDRQGKHSKEKAFIK